MTNLAIAPARRRLVEAVAWRTQLTDADAGSSEAFEAWLAEPGCADAWAQVQGSWEFMSEQAATPELLELRRRALRNARNAGREQTHRLPGRWRRIALAACVLVTIGVAFFAWRLNSPEVYKAAIGEMRVVTLRDGSRVALDSRSEIRVRYSRNARELELSRGQASFEVAHDVERPFSVTAAGQKVIATGTAFNVDMLKSKTLITLISGSVAVVPSTHDGGTRSSLRRSPASLKMSAGEQLVVSASSPPYVRAVNVQRATAWQTGRLIFDDEPLSSVVERVSRYADRPVLVGDDQTGALRISGAFRTGDIDGFVETISNYVGVRAEQGKQGEIVLRRRS